MEHMLSIYNTLTRKKEKFVPLNPPKVGLYVCGPTVYGEAHLGHARPAVIYDVLYRYLTFLGYQVRYVRNITDVGHLENDADEGEDKISKRAKLDKIEPMELVQKYINSYHENIRLLNAIPPSIEPQASGHIIEQQQMIKEILQKKFAYVENGSVYFDVEKYDKQYGYGKLSGRNLKDMLSNTRELSGQDEKRSPFDFAIWKKASPEHIMRWPSEWSDGFPGWHLECSAMSTKYLGETFDIHGGGMDLLFPHHEGEIAQSRVAHGHDQVRYWMHNNMITIDGQKMGKSLNNFITLDELFSGDHRLLEQSYTPMTVRFFILQAHYGSTLDFSNSALQAAEKGLKRLLKSIELIDEIKAADASDFSVSEIREKCFDALNDDLNTPVAIAHLFDAVKNINLLKEGSLKLKRQDLAELRKFMHQVTFDILGLKPEMVNSATNNLEKDLINLIVDLRLEARNKKDFAASDIIRDKLSALGIQINDTKEGTSWEKS